MNDQAIGVMAHAQACARAIQYLKHIMARLYVSAWAVRMGFDDSESGRRDLEEYNLLQAIIDVLEEDCREGV